MAQGEFEFSDSTKKAPAKPVTPPPVKPKVAAKKPVPDIFTVTQLTRLIKLTLSQNLPGKILLSGEISNFKRHSSGHVYLTLKDEDSQITSVMWKSAAGKLKFAPYDGLAVVATGRVDVYQPQGKYQFYIDKLEPAGVGALELAYRQLAEKLRGEGLFDQAHKKPIPAYPATVAIVTSATGAAIQDMVKTLSRRFRSVRKLLFPVSVQGEAAAGEIAEAITLINRHQKQLGGIDVMIVGRGGGSIEDLWPFNEEIVARAVYASEIPVISGVGHETDTTIIDLVADRRAVTPTAAAELAVGVQDKIMSDVLQIQQRLNLALNRLYADAGKALSNLGTRGLFARPLDAVQFRGQTVDELSATLSSGMSEILRDNQRVLENRGTVLRRIEPHYVLSQARTRLIQQQHLMQNSTVQYHQQLEHQIKTCLVKIDAHKPQQEMTRQRVLLNQTAERIGRGYRIQNKNRRERIKNISARLAGVDPRSILKRGYSITRLKISNNIVADDKSLKAGDIILTELADKRFIESEIIEQEDTKEGNNG
ncbi:MAG: exodeoxyribonuclease VII large subunit [Planctomycetes bacterium]|nr:exodeoxyribonuclease VII large subunit [Planctomycetota bacterium]